METIMPGEVRLNWSRVRERGGGSYVEYRVSDDVAVAFSESAAGTGAVAIPLDLREELPDSIAGEGLEAGRAFFPLGGRRQSCMTLFCSSRELEKVFSEFVAALLARMKEGMPPLAASEEIVREYRALLRRQRSGTVSREAAMGLVGELLVLGKLTGFSTTAWETWTGPLDQTHDFVSGYLSIEVKTTSHEAEPSFEVANALQLYPNKGGELFLVHHVLLPDPKGKVTASALVKNIRERLPDPAGFDSRLEAANFDRAAPEAWDQYAFQLTHSSMYRIEEGFPRMPREILDDLPNGVSNIRYRVHLSQATEFRINDPGEIDRVYSRMGVADA